MFKWTVKKAGVYNLSAFEPYAFRYANVITSAGVKANVKVRAYENPEAGKMLFECDDKKSSGLWKRRGIRSRTTR
ncbi:MAG: hypothetical protein ACLR06_16305 [Christensenellaceae bacterium]